MVYMNKNAMDYETMLQIVPSSAGLSPSSSTGSEYYTADISIDAFDLSVLSDGRSDGEVPFCAQNNSGNVQQLLSFYGDASVTSTASIYPSSTAGFGYSKKFTSQIPSYEDAISFLKKGGGHNFQRYHPWNNGNASKSPPMKREKPFYEEEAFGYRNVISLDSERMDVQSEWDDVSMQRSLSSAASSSPSDYSCPQTPAEFTPSAPVPAAMLHLEDIKQEITLDLQSLLEDDTNQSSMLLPSLSPLQNQTHEDNKSSPELLRSILEKKNSPFQEGSGDKSSNNGDHKLLRQVLKDTSFQKRYNLKPIDIEGLGTAYQTEGIKMENASATIASDVISMKEDVSSMVNLSEGNLVPMLSNAIKQLMQDVDNTCIMLGIPRDPQKWSVEDVKNWLLWNARQYNLPIPTNGFDVDGRALLSFGEQDFQERAPLCGSLLYAQLEIWKAEMDDTHLDVNNLLVCDMNPSSSSSIEISDDEEEDEDNKVGKAVSSVGNASATNATACKFPSTRGTATHIHLWQFLKELLSMPQVYGCCIRWLDRRKGIFKIEDSIRVARLWGERKNRPAMNYDKLSRSIRQYYKKGIMKKTERSQRLVYQFCTPYNV